MQAIVLFFAGYVEDVAGEDAVVVVSLDFLEAALGKPKHALEVSSMAPAPAVNQFLSCFLQSWSRCLS